MNTLRPIDCRCFGSLEIDELYEYEPGYLLGRLEILGTLHHIELLEVEYDAERSMRAVPHEMNENEERFEELVTITGVGNFQTVEIDGREFVCRVVPFGA